MKNKFKKILLRIVILAVIPIVFFASILLYIQFTMYRLVHLDHVRILSDCRTIIANRNLYHNDKNQWGTLHEGDVLLLSPITNDVPELIRKLKPENIIIREDYVMINLRIPLSRIGLIGFTPAAKQFGTFKYIDGLWFWDGDDSTKETH